MPKIKVPQYYEMMNPLIQAMRELGGSGTNKEIEAKVAEVMGLSDEQVEYEMKGQNAGRPLFEYRLAWTRSYLKKYGLLENSKRGVWSLTPEGRKVDRLDAKHVAGVVKNLMKKEEEKTVSDAGVAEPDESQAWQDELRETLLQMEPSAFERLVQRLLRESGFVQVEVTGQSGDGGIDGKGIIRIGGLISFPVIFQCKRYKGSVGSDKVRDLRGSMVGRAEKGLLITTGTFTREAEKEATRDGAPPIDLIDGELLMEKLKELSLGVDTKVVEVEQVSIDEDWFLNL
jgi:restriction system protein